MVKRKGFIKDKPERSGLYQYICDENGNIADSVAITSDEQNLTVHSEDLSRTPLDRFHDGLTDLQWRFIA